MEVYAHLFKTKWYYVIFCRMLDVIILIIFLLLFFFCFCGSELILFASYSYLCACFIERIKIYILIRETFEFF